MSVGVGVATSEEIDRFNILQATFMAMKRAIDTLKVRPDYVLVDGNQLIPGLNIPQQAIPKGDQLSVSISAASIIAKGERDANMEKYHEQFPQYN
ncbi:MAG TPA: ribonuclease HII, partial [Deltaproteobacteria bacterium]|nr:ribonuclease HII [Deltaproteobacteria bacterium]